VLGYIGVEVQDQKIVVQKERIAADPPSAQWHSFKLPDA
jgi:hypothetical protein